MDIASIGDPFTLPFHSDLGQVGRRKAHHVEARFLCRNLSLFPVSRSSMSFLYARQISVFLIRGAKVVITVLPSMC